MRRCFLKPEIGIFEIAVMPSPFGDCATRTEEVFVENTLRALSTSSVFIPIRQILLYGAVFPIL